LSTTLLCVITQPVVAVCYRRFGTLYRSHLQGSRLECNVDGQASNEEGSTGDRAFYIRFKTVHSDCSYECTASTVNVFETGITLPGRSEGSRAVATPCRLQLCAVLWRAASRLSAACSAVWEI